MKKVLLLLSLLFTLQAYSQTPISIKSIKFSAYNIETDGFDAYSTAYPDDTYLSLSTESRKITITGENPHIFKIENLLRDSYRSNGYDCTNFSGTDDEGRDVAICICINKPLQEGFVLILYSHKYTIVYNF